MKRKALTDEGRLEILDLLNKHSTTRVAEITGRSMSTISTVKGESQKIIKNLSQIRCGNLLQTKRHRLMKHEELDIELYNLFEEKRGEKIPINGPILLAQVTTFN